MLKKFIVIFSILLSWQIYGANSLRRCLILPITDGMKASIGPIVFNKVEAYLKNSTWCYYQSNSGLIDILNRYQHKLKEYLQNPEVLKVIARKTKAGSLIGISLDPSSAGIELSVKVYGENGVDVYYSEKTLLNHLDGDVVAQLIINWLEEYNKTIPYDVRVTGILGDSFTLDMGDNIGLNAGDKVDIVRPTKKKRHPLFKEIVDWETKSIAQGRIVHVTEQQAQAKVLKYAGVRERIKLEDWGLIKKTTALDPNHKPTQVEDEYQFGKLGTIAFLSTLNNFSLSQNYSTNSKRQDGFLFGGNIETEIWITRHYWIGLDVGLTTGTLSKDEGEYTAKNTPIYTSRFKLKVGYKYLPLGFFYGPQIDFVFGYESDSLSLDNSIPDQIVGVTYKGLTAGVYGNIPIYKKTRIFLYFDFVPFAGFDEDTKLLGEPDGISIYKFGIGASYSYKMNIEILGGFHVKSSKVSYDSLGCNFIHKNSSFNFGAKFTF